MEVLAHGLEDLGLLPVSAEEALDPGAKVYGRWTLHGTSHMLGLDVHDCGQAAPEAYAEGTSPRAWCSPSSPGLYFQEDDLLVPEELRGIGIRIEDDILVTADGFREPLRLRSPAPPPTSRRGWPSSAAEHRPPGRPGPSEWRGAECLDPSMGAVPARPPGLYGQPGSAMLFHITQVHDPADCPSAAADRANSTTPRSRG